MKYFALTFIYLSVLSRLVFGLSPTYLACQLKKATGEPPLTGCPKGTLYVSSNDSSANFSSVQEAIQSLSELSEPAIILIGEGRYFEMVNVTRSAPLVLLGQLDPDTASIRGGNASQRNLVCIWNNRYASEDGWSDEETATLTVKPATGSPFGNTDFKAYNIDFENRAAHYPISQALVTSMTLANASFYGCTFRGWQDTWFTGYGANTYVFESIIFGQVDFIFGCGTAWFQSVTIALRACGGGITAFAGTQSTTNGVYIADSWIIRSPDADQATVTTGKCFLGRPWNQYSTAVFLRDYMDDSIHPDGFRSWTGHDTIPSTGFFAEYDSRGPGGNTSARVGQEHILDLEQSQKYRLEKVFQEWPGWIDFSYHYT